MYVVVELLAEPTVFVYMQKSSQLVTSGFYPSRIFIKSWYSNGWYSNGWYTKTCSNGWYSNAGMKCKHDKSCNSLNLIVCFKRRYNIGHVGQQILPCECTTLFESRYMYVTNRPGRYHDNIGKNYRLNRFLTIFQKYSRYHINISSFLLCNKVLVITQWY